jgi:hypothetical protein
MNRITVLVAGVILLAGMTGCKTSEGRGQCDCAGNHLPPSAAEPPMAHMNAVQETSIPMPGGHVESQVIPPRIPEAINP